MPVATKISTNSHHHRTQAYPSHPSQYHAYESASDSTVSNSIQEVGKSVEARENPPQQRCSRVQGAMSSHYPRRSYSDSKSNAKETYVKEPRVVVREVRRKSDSEHRHHQRRSEKEDGNEGERVRGYRTQRRSEGEADRYRPSTIRRSTTNAGEATRTRHERQRTEDRKGRRRHSERRSSHHEEKAHTPLRREKRSVADHAPKSTRDRPPVTRCAT